MSDGIVKGIGDQLGELGKDIAQEVADLPSQLLGLETNSQKSNTNPNPQAQAAAGGEDFKKKISQIKAKDEQKKNKELNEARRLIAQFSQSTPQQPSVYEQKIREQDEKKESQTMQQIAAQKKQLPQTPSKQPRGMLMAKKQTGSESKLNVKAQ